jgi:hypothetical protein
MRNKDVSGAIYVGAGLVLPGLASVPSLATMLNPANGAWTDRYKVLNLGVDLSPQHFGSIWIRLKGNGQFQMISVARTDSAQVERTQGWMSNSEREIDAVAGCRVFREERT